MSNSTTHWDNIDTYATKDFEYADKARKLLYDEIGFEPDIRASRVTEVYMRGSLKRLDEGELTQEQVNIHIKDYANVIKKRILREIPEQAHLLKQD